MTNFLIYMSGVATIILPAIAYGLYLDKVKKKKTPLINTIDYEYLWDYSGIGALDNIPEYGPFKSARFFSEKFDFSINGVKKTIDFKLDDDIYKSILEKWLKVGHVSSPHKVREADRMYFLLCCFFTEPIYQRIKNKMR